MASIRTAIELYDSFTTPMMNIIHAVSMGVSAMENIQGCLLYTSIKWGQVILIRELDKQPDMTKIEATKKAIDHILKSYAEGKKRKCVK